MIVDCNRIMIDGKRLCIVKDTCLGCKINYRKCAINDLLEDAGVLKNWENWNMPTFRERMGNDKKQSH